MSNNKNKVFKCHYCGRSILNERDLVIKPVPLSTKNGVKNYKRKFHMKCVHDYIDTLDSQVLKQEENSWWEKCYEMARSWLGVSEGQNLDQHFVMRLKGLRVGKYLPNGDNTHIIKRGYSFETIYRTMQLCQGDGSIRKALNEVSFSNQQHKINYLMKIVTSKINFISVKMNANKRAKTKLDSVEDNNYRNADYINKNNKKNTKLATLINDTISDDEDDADDLFN